MSIFEYIIQLIMQFIQNGLIYFILGGHIIAGVIIYLVLRNKEKNGTLDESDSNESENIIIEE